MTKLINMLLAATALMAAVSLNSSQAAPSGTTKNIVLVHGAFADGSGWKAVAELLRKRGYSVSIVQPPETSLEDDVAATNRVLDALDGPGGRATSR
jgi:hypothetical protein